MARLLEATSIGKLTTANRVVRSATWEGMADDDGNCTPELTALMEQLAASSVGLIVTGHAYVSREGQGGRQQLGVSMDKHVPGLTKMVEAVHAEEGKIVLQLAHAGALAARAQSGLPALGPVAKKSEQGPICREMTPADITKIVEAFAKAAVRASRAGFDGVQIHAAHGYLLSQFLSSFYNRRTDEYGDSLENRARFLMEVVRSIRESVDADFPLLVKMNSEDFVEGGMSVTEMLSMARMLEKAGVDAIELSGGTPDSPPELSPVRKGFLRSEEEEAYYRAAAKQYKKAIEIPLILVGGIRSPAVARALVSEGVTDFVSFSRPLIREPNLIGRWQMGDQKEATCLSCNLCFRPALMGLGLRCMVDEKLRRKQDR